MNQQVIEQLLGGEPFLSVECDESSNGKVTRQVRLCKLDTAKIAWLYEKLSPFDTLFDDYIRGDFEDFLRVFLKPLPSGDVEAAALVWEVDDVGILYLTDIVPGVEALVHAAFWDRRLNGRENLVREMVKFLFSNFDFNRLTARIGLFSKPTLEFVERVGFKKEGRLRQATRYKGDWFDVNIYSILREEVENGSEDENG